MKFYKYVYGHLDTGLLHTERVHLAEYHKEADCYVIKSEEIKNLTLEEVEHWQRELKENIIFEKGNFDELPHGVIKLMHEDFEAWFQKRQTELYGTPPIRKQIEEVLEHDKEIPESVSEMLNEFLDSDKE